MTPYGVGGGHRHTPEMIQNLSAAAGERVTVSFTPTLAPMPRGILATCSAKARPGVSADSLRAVYGKAFADEPFVDLLPEGQWPATAAVYGSNAVQVQVAHDPAIKYRIVVVCAIDNLAKGTRGRRPPEHEHRPRAPRGHRTFDDRSRTVSVTAAQGFSAAGIAAGIKESGNPDLALVVNHGPRRAAAGVFTSNRVKAAPVLWSEQVLKGGEVTAVVLNSGGANACTGPQGFQDTHATAEKAAEVLEGHSAGEIAVASTGLIGIPLPMDKLLPGIEQAAAALSEHGGEKAAIAIKTTDTVHKTAVAGGEGWTVGGMAKGGMLAPGLATMLVVLTTDADVPSERLDAALREATRTTFDRVDSDGCMSTNDTVLLLASG